MEGEKLKDLIENFSFSFFEKIKSEWEEHQSPLKNLSSKETNELFFKISQNSLLENTINAFLESNLTVVSLQDIVSSKLEDFFFPSFKNNTPKARISNLTKDCLSKLLRIQSLEKIILVKKEFSLF